MIYGKPVWNPYNVEKTVAGTTFIAAIHGTDHPFIRVYVVLGAEGLALAISPPRILDIPLPACILNYLVDQPFDPSVGWMRDLEITLAWVTGGAEFPAVRPDLDLTRYPRRSSCTAQRQER